jgi:crotonobetainyl-CoA:carnitine CoA-transferase CaiB-like acyl-CoA transferase
MSVEFRPLVDLTALLRFGERSTDLGRVAVMFAGLVATQFGATVIRVEGDDDRLTRAWKPLLPDGRSALFHFLTQGQRAAPADFTPPAGAYLVTDDADVFDGWPSEAKVLVRAAFDVAAERPQSELTIMAASGLLDIMGEPGRPPLPLAGHAVAYAAGLAAFDAMLVSHLAAAFHGTPCTGEVSCLDVATWLNWKLTLDSVSGPREAGIDRREEWLIQRCRDGYVAVIFLDKDIPQLAKLTRSERLLDPDFSTGPRRRAHLSELHNIVANALAQRSRDDVIREAEELRLPFAPVLSPSEVVDDAQMRHRKFFREDGAIVTPMAPVVWDGVRPGAVHDVTPKVDSA